MAREFDEDAPEAPEPGEGLDDEEVSAIVGKMIDEAVSWSEQELEPDRVAATDYYRARPFGDEERGRSQVVLPEVRDTIVSMMPSFMGVFFGSGKRVVEYVARRPEAVQWAEQATNFVDSIVVKTDNPGFLVYYSWFKDALLKRLGVVKVWWETAEPEAYCAYNLLPEQAQQIAGDPDVTITKSEQKQGSGQTLLWDIEYTRPRAGRVRFDCVPPEEFGYSKDARSLEDAVCVFHKTKKTRSQLVAMGVPEDVIEEYGGIAPQMNQSLEAQARQPTGQVPERTQTGDESTDEITYIEAYPKIDVDGDDIAELRLVKMIGPGYHVIENKPTQRRPFALLGMDPEPHTIQGLGIKDYVGDLQNIGSHVLRALLDSLSQSIFPRTAFVEGEVNAQDVLSQEMGAPIRMTKPGMVQPILVPFVGKEAMGVLEKLSDIKEQRTGITKASAGLNPDALQSSTQAAVAATVTAAQQRMELISRIFAETGVKTLYRLILAELVENQPTERFARLNGQYVTIDPRLWDVDMDVSVSVALGTGSDVQKLSTLALLTGKMEQLYQTLGPNNPLFTMGQYRNALAKMLEINGFQDTTQFLNPMPVEFNPPPPEQPQSSPEEQVAQAEVMRAQADVQATTAKTQADIQKRNSEIQAATAEMALAERRLSMEMAFKEKQLAAEMAMKQRELELKFNAEMQGEAMRAELKRNEIALSHAPSNEREIEVQHDPETGRVSKLRVKEVKE